MHALRSGVADNDALSQPLHGYTGALLRPTGRLVCYGAVNAQPRLESYEHTLWVTAAI